MTFARRFGWYAWLHCYIYLTEKDFFHEQIREYVDGTDLETLMKNPSLCPSLRSPEERMRIAVGIAKVGNSPCLRIIMTTSGNKLSAQPEEPYSSW